MQINYLCVSFHFSFCAFGFFFKKRILLCRQNCLKIIWRKRQNMSFKWTRLAAMNQTKYFKGCWRIKCSWKYLRRVNHWIFPLFQIIYRKNFLFKKNSFSENSVALTHTISIQLWIFSPFLGNWLAWMIFEYFLEIS